MYDFIIGLALAIFSSSIIGTSFIFKKKGLLRLSVRAGVGGFGYFKEWYWWAGFLLMSIGEITNFIAFTFAPASLITPLGALSVLVSSFLASRYLKEKLNILGKVGCLICVLGTILIVLHAPKENELRTMHELALRLEEPGFIIYGLSVLLTSMFLILYVSPRYGQSNPLVYITITGGMGSLSVMACKGLGTAIRQTLEGDEQASNWLTWVMVACIAFFISVQMIYLNRALDVFNTAIVTPLLYVVFTGCVLIASAILFKEWERMEAKDTVGCICSFLIIILGIFLLQVFKDANLTLLSLPHVRRESIIVNSSNGVVKHASSELFKISIDEETTALFEKESVATKYHKRTNSVS